MTPFSALLGAITPDGDGWTVGASADWRQGRTLYGGLSAALCLEACLRTVPDLPPLRSAQIAFVGPAADTLALRTRVLRRGKSATFMTADLTSAGESATHATFCFGGPRDSAYARTAPTAPTAEPPEVCPDFFPKDRAPAFAQHYEVKLAAGAPPVSGAKEPDLLLWARHRDAAAPANAVALLALADAPPPAAFITFTAPAPISTMTWSIEFLDQAHAAARAWTLLRSTALAIRDGYSAQRMAIWDEGGAPVAIGQQTVAVFG
jgi:acyl-CoA thioesterase